MDVNYFSERMTDMDEKEIIKDTIVNVEKNQNIPAKPDENRPNPLDMPGKKVVDYTYTW